jgi:hypothetical protein
VFLFPEYLGQKVIWFHPSLKHEILESRRLTKEIIRQKPRLEPSLVGCESLGTPPKHSLVDLSTLEPVRLLKPMCVLFSTRIFWLCLLTYDTYLLFNK